MLSQKYIHGAFINALHHICTFTGFPDMQQTIKCDPAMGAMIVVGFSPYKYLQECPNWTASIGFQSLRSGCRASQSSVLRPPALLARARLSFASVHEQSAVRVFSHRCGTGIMPVPIAGCG